MENQNIVSIFSLPALWAACGSSAQYEIQSIKNNKLCETNPIFETLKMNLTYYATNDYERKSPSSTLEKRTQTKPISNEHSMQRGKLLKILKILPVRHLTYRCNWLKYWFSYGYGNFYEKLFGEKR
jgi:hypothetical protein